MSNPFLHADTIRFGSEEAARMHALALADAAEKLRNPGEGSELVVLQTYTLELIGPRNHALESEARIANAFLHETEENLTDLLPEGYSVRIKEWDEEEQF